MSRTSDELLMSHLHRSEDNLVLASESWNASLRVGLECLQRPVHVVHAQSQLGQQLLALLPGVGPDVLVQHGVHVVLLMTEEDRGGAGQGERDALLVVQAPGTLVIIVPPLTRVSWKAILKKTMIILSISYQSVVVTLNASARSHKSFQGSTTVWARLS